MYLSSDAPRLSYRRYRLFISVRVSIVVMRLESNMSNSVSFYITVYSIGAVVDISPSEFWISVFESERVSLFDI